MIDRYVRKFAQANENLTSSVLKKFRKRERSRNKYICMKTNHCNAKWVNKIMMEGGKTLRVNTALMRQIKFGLNILSIT